MKYLAYHNLYSRRYFWRTHAQQEIDYVEERNGLIYAFEFKWNKKAMKKFPASLVNAYHPAVSMTVNKENFESFLETPY